YIERKLGKSRLNITGSSRSVACKNVTPVTLSIDKQILLSYLYHGVTYTGISVRVILHSVPYHVSHLVVPAIVQFFKGMHYPALYRFQASVNGRYGTLQDNIGSIIQKPVFIHTRYLGNGIL